MENDAEVEVSIKLTAKETGKLYMSFLERGKRIRRLQATLNCVRLMLLDGGDADDILVQVNDALGIQKAQPLVASEAEKVHE